MISTVTTDRSGWDRHANELADALIAYAAGNRGEEAGLSLLFAHEGVAWATDEFERYLERFADGRVRVDWRHLHRAAESRGWPRHEQALVLLACSLASVHCQAPLKWAIGHLREGLLAVLVAAVAHAGGRT